MQNSMSSTTMDQNKKVLTYNRFLDVDEEPKKMLQPIEGYQKFPLVSLEEAVKPIIFLCPDIERRVYIAKSNCTKPAHGLTCDESAAIYLYTMEWDPSSECLYAVLNSTLRTEDRHKLKPWFSYLKLFLTALDKIPSGSLSIWRGVRVDLQSEYEVNKIYTWWAFSSCTKNLTVLQSDYLLGKTGKRTLLNIECENGKDIKLHSHHAGEEEILLLPATQFIVKSIIKPSTNDPDFTIIHLEEVKPKFPLLESPN